MTTPTAAPPPSREEAPPEPPQSTPVMVVHAPLRRMGRRSYSGRPSAGVLAGAIGVHVVLIGLAVAFLKIGPGLLWKVPPAETVEYFDLAFPEEVGPSAASGTAPAPGEVSFPAERAPAEAPPPSAPQAERGDREQAPGEELVFPSGVPSGLPQTGGAPAATGAGAGGQPGGTGVGGAGRLTPGIRDSRLIPSQRPVPAKPDQTPHEEYMGRLGATLGEYNDSVAAEAERARNALDWTLKDKDGNRWGVSPGKIHLGKLTLPNPVGFAGSPERTAEAAKEGRQRIELDRQVAESERRNSFQERVKATRERKDAERRAIRGET